MGRVQPTPGAEYKRQCSIDCNSELHVEAQTVTKNELPPDDSVDIDAQPGVQKIEAVTLSWTTRSLLLTYGMIWLIYFTEGVISGVSGVLSPRASSAFTSESLIPTTFVLTFVIGGATTITIAKVMDVFGRPQGYTISLCLAVVGLVIMAACKTVEGFAAAEVFYTVGKQGVVYSLCVIPADTSSPRNRGLVLAFLSSPSPIITEWLAQPIANAFLKGPGWRWGFGALSIIAPGVSLPLLGLFIYNYQKAKRLNVVTYRRPSQLPTWQCFLHHCNEFDVIGLVLLSAGVVFFLLPFRLYTMQGQRWNSATVISSLVFGVLLMAAFALWEIYLARVTILPYHLLKDRTVVGACLLSFTWIFSYTCWNYGSGTVLQVVNNLPVEDVTHVLRAQTVGSVVASVAGGYLIRRTGYFKPMTLYFGIPLTVLALSLMVGFRGPHASTGYVVACQIFASCALGVIMICEQVAVLAAVNHQYFAISIALLIIFENIGGAVGSAASSAIWQGNFRKKLAKYLPAADLVNFPVIYQDVNAQLAYPEGSPTRLAIQNAYSDVQRLLLITGIVIWVVGIGAVLMWRNIDVRAMKQTKGRVF